MVLSSQQLWVLADADIEYCGAFAGNLVLFEPVGCIGLALLDSNQGLFILGPLGLPLSDLSL